MISFKVRIFGIMFKESFPTPRSYRKSYLFFILIFISLGKNNFFREWVPDKLFNFIACLKRLIFHPCLWMLDQMHSFWVPLELQPVSIELCKYCSKFYYSVAKRKLEGISFSSERNFFSLKSTYIHLYLSLYLYCCGSFNLLMYSGFTMCKFLLCTAKWFSYTYTICTFFFTFFPIMVYHRILTVVPCEIQ